MVADPPEALLYVYWHTERLLLKPIFPSLKYMLKTLNFSIMCNGNEYLVLSFSSHRNSEEKCTVTRSCCMGECASQQQVWSLVKERCGNPKKNSVCHAGIHGQASGKHLQPQSCGPWAPLGNETEGCNGLSPDTIGNQMVSAPRRHLFKSEYCHTSVYVTILDKKTLCGEEGWERCCLRTLKKSWLSD